jgi:hypothetical protein
MRSLLGVAGLLLLILLVRCSTSSGAATGADSSAPPGTAECCVGGGQFALCNVCPDVDCGVQQGTVCPLYTYGCAEGGPWQSAPDYSQCPPEAAAPETSTPEAGSE